MLSFKTLATFLVFASSLSFGQTPPQVLEVKPPKGFEEGTETRLTAAQLKELEPYATNSMTRLRDALEETKNINGSRALDILLNKFRQISTLSGARRNEMLMRYVIHRGLKIAEIVQEQSDSSNKIAVDQTVRILKRSAEMAIDYYESDFEFVNGRGVPRYSDDRLIDYSSFGVDYGIFLMSIQESMPDISAQYTIARLSLGLLQYDLYRDLNRRAMAAPAISRLQDTMTATPETATSDSAEYLNHLIRIRRDFLYSAKFMSDAKNGMNLQLRYAVAARPEDRKLVRGDRIISKEGKWGVVLKVTGAQATVYFEENKATNTQDGEQNVSISELSVGVDEFRNVKPGMIFRDYQCDQFEVIEVFATGLVRAYYKKFKMSFPLQMLNGVGYSVQFPKRGRECDI